VRIATKLNEIRDTDLCALPVAGESWTVQEFEDRSQSLCESVVFNCSDQLDYLAMAKFFKGLASSGAWACFDEFNRIDIEVLSVVAQQVATIQLAVKAKERRFMFEGVDLSLKWTCAPFITMNPGYAGRTELPDNLAALFRPVAMMVPDYGMIAEIFLYSFGFQDAKPLSTKLTTVFKLSSEQLSAQDHYDFGMRAVKTVITAAGNLKRAFGDVMAEDQIALRAIRDVNVPKFLQQDLLLFEGIVSDLFPNTKLKEIDYGKFEQAIKDGCAEHKLQPVPGFVTKVIQLYETTVVRHGLMLVGPTCSGKTRCREVLTSAITALGVAGELDDTGSPFTKINNFVLNPKSITMGQLYGQFDPLTHEWTDGILSTLVRLGVASQTDEKKWFVFDGPVDAIWIENMNTVLDDNKKLCLASGEIIALTDEMTMMFEVEDLTVASPATVSRCGMVYLEPQILGLKPFVKSWLEHQLPDVVEPYKADLEKLFDTYLEPAVLFVRLNLNEMNESVDGALCFSFLKLFDCFLEPYMDKEGRKVETYREDAVADLIEPWFFFCLTWSIGATCDGPGRLKFDEYLRAAMEEGKANTKFPAEGVIYDYCLKDDAWRNEDGNGDDDDEEERTSVELGWKKWTDGAIVPEIDPKQEFSTIFIPTMDTICTEYLLNKLMTNGKQVCVIGPTGTGKTLNVTNKLLTGMHKRYLANFINFSAQTNANQTQDMIDAKLDKRRKGIYAPPLGKKFIIYIDDLNMPALEEYGAQPPIEIVRQWMDHQGWYDRKAIGSFMTLIDMSFCCSMGPPGGGRNKVSNRLMRHFNFMTMQELSDVNMATIFTPILTSYLNQVKVACKPTTINNVVGETIKLFNAATGSLLPTPAKVHYLFNLRDLAKVFQGMLMNNVKAIVEEVQIVRSWVHECNRVFRDRLINDKDREFFDNICKTAGKDTFGYEWEEVCPNTPLIYGDFLDASADPKIYGELPKMQEVKDVMNENLQEYNDANSAKMNLVLFEDAIMHCTKISRVIRQPFGNALLLGVGGSGRQSMTRLAAHIAEFECFQVTLSKNYGMTEWRDDLKVMMQKAGIEDKPIVFLFSDTQIKNESFLEDINNILNSGNVPGIYETPELDQIYAALKPVVQAEGMQLTKANMFAKYCSRVRYNVHSVICMSPIGEIFRSRLRQFPALVSCCTIDWFSAWPDEALRSVAASILGDIPTLTDEVVIAKVTDMASIIHQSAVNKSAEFLAQLGRTNYVTPTAYLSLLSVFKGMIGKKQKALKDGRDKTDNGLTKLKTTEIEVEELREELKAMQPMLKQAAIETEEAMVEITASKAVAEDKAIVVGKEEKDATEKAAATKAIADDAQRDLDEALPALDAAVASLKSLKKEDITEVKALTNPPAGVKIVMEGVCIMFGVKPNRINGEKPGEKIDDYWPQTGKLLQNPGKFLDSLFAFDKENISASAIKKIKPYIDNPVFTPQNIAKVSKACTAICSWVRAMDKYYHISRMVAPKRAALKEANESLQVTLKALAGAKAQLQEVNDSLSAMEVKFEAMVQKKKQLEDKAEECAQRLQRAERLINGLGGEKVRWVESIKKADQLLVNVIGDIVVSAGTVAYLGPFTEEYRTALGTMWREKMKEIGLEHTDGADLTSTLSEAVEVRDWQMAGLPKDSMSTENACVVKYSERWPLFIDPQGQANRWVRLKEGDKLVVMKLSDRDFLRSLENAVRFGSPCLLENVGEELDPALEPILLQQTFIQAGSVVIKLGDSVIPYHDDFCFYITTKLPNPLYTPEVSTKATVINFTLSPSGLEDQMLGLVVAQERPDLEAAKNDLIINNAKMKAELKGLEDLILKLLSESQGSPVDDIELIDTLDASKIKADEIQLKVADAEKTEKDIDVIRMKYIPVAVRSQILFFAVTSLSQVDPMYQYSLTWFRQIFLQSLEKSEKNDEDLEARIVNINDYFTFSLYSNVCRSLFERHKLLFSFLMCARILMGRDEINMAEWRFLITGGTATPEQLDNPGPEWVSERSWLEILTLPALPVFAEFAKDFGNNITEWRAIFDSLEPHKCPFPGRWDTELDTFQKLIVMRCLRYDKLPDMLQDFVSARIGQRFIEPQTANLGQVYPDTTPSIPLIFILSNGTDPAADLQVFAEEMKMSKKLTSISLGQGQGPKAEALFRAGVERGTWVFFQNCHLAPSWMPTMERIIENIDPGKVHRDFRLWLTSMPSPKFPVPVLQNGSKMTVEPPRGVKANLLGVYDALDDDYLNKVTEDKVSDWKSLLFSLCIFHGVLLERRKFGPLGFNIRYGYTQSDLQICMTQLSLFLEDYDDPPYKVLVYTAGHINYGGRVTDNWDRRLQLCLLKTFYNTGVPGEGYKFSPSGTYSMPAVTDLEGYRDYIRSRPINDNPEMFGLHDNANITYANNETDGLLGAILDAGGSGGGGGGGGGGRDAKLEALALDIMGKVAQPFDLRAISIKHPVMYEESMNTVLIQEAIRFNKLLTLLHRSLKDLSKALKGLVVMSEDLEKASNALFDNQVPGMWSKVSYPSLKPLAAWVMDLQERLKFIQKWVDGGTPPAFWISGFYFPQAFLTGTLQNYARRHVVSIDTLSFSYRVLTKKAELITKQPKEGVYIYGMYLEGARWDAANQVLAESRPKELFTSMAPILLEPEVDRVQPDDGIYMCPCYKTLVRAGLLSTTGHSTNFVMPLEIPSSETQDHWIRRGVALFCALNY